MSQPDQFSENERLVMFSDAVIAITITLLVLEIRVPEDFGDMTDAQLWPVLTSLWADYLSYILSFLVIGTFWIGHNRKFQYIVRSSGTLIWLNLLYLCAIGFMPFVTHLISENGGSLSTIAYAGIVTVVSLIGATMSFYASAARLTKERANPWRTATPSLTTALVFGISIPIALLDADAAKYFWLALIPAGIIAGRLSHSAD
jgi:uncharacterized membrane protein